MNYSSSSKGGLQDGLADPPTRGHTAPRRGDQRPSTDALLYEIERPCDGRDDDRITVALVARARDGDQLAFAELYIRYFDRVRRYLEIALKNVHDSEDATQQIFVKVLEALPRYEQRGEPFRAWLFRLVRNHALDLQRRSWRSETADPTSIAKEQDEALARAFARAADDADYDLQPLTAALPDAQQRVLVLRYVYDLSPGEVAEVLEINVDAVRHTQMRALKTLARGLGVKRTPRSPAHGDQHLRSAARARLS